MRWLLCGAEKDCQGRGAPVWRLEKSRFLLVDLLGGWGGNLTPYVCGKDHKHQELESQKWGRAVFSDRQGELVSCIMSRALSFRGILWRLYSREGTVDSARGSTEEMRRSAKRGVKQGMGPLLQRVERGMETKALLD